MSCARLAPGFRSRLGGAVVLGCLLWTSPGSAVGSPPGPEATVEVLAPGVEHIELRRPNPDLVAHVARVAPDAPARLEAVLAGDRVGAVAPGRERTSDMCARAGGAICINADFAMCPGCREVLGGFANGGVIRRSFHPEHEQFSLTTDGFTEGRPAWSGELRATMRWPASSPPAASNPLAPPPGPVPAREEVHRVRVDALNRFDTGRSVLLSADWGAPTVSVEGERELLVAIDARVPHGVHRAELVALRDAGDALADGEIAVRASSEVATEFWNAWTSTTAPERSLVLETTSPAPLLATVGAHPVLISDGQRMPLDLGDGKMSQRHPRSLVGWTASGELLLVSIDGRRRGWSAGATLTEATDLLLELGATNALNLDGGGSTTFVSPCAAGPCVVNRPSDGEERAVPSALAVIVDEGVEVRRPERRGGRASEPGAKQATRRAASAGTPQEKPDSASVAPASIPPPPESHSVDPPLTEVVVAAPPSEAPPDAAATAPAQPPSDPIEVTPAAASRPGRGALAEAAAQPDTGRNGQTEGALRLIAGALLGAVLLALGAQVRKTAASGA